MILMERYLDEIDCTVSIEKLSAVEVQVNVRDSLGVIEWCRNTTSGELALDMYWHPFAYGLRIEPREDIDAMIDKIKAIGS